MGLLADNARFGQCPKNAGRVSSLNGDWWALPKEVSGDPIRDETKDSDVHRLQPLLHRRRHVAQRQVRRDEDPPLFVQRRCPSSNQQNNGSARNQCWFVLYAICEDSLPIKPAVEKSHRIGKPQTGRTQYLLVTLRNEASVLELLQCALYSTILLLIATSSLILIELQQKLWRPIKFEWNDSNNELKLKRPRKKIRLIAILIDFLLMLLFSHRRSTFRFLFSTVNTC